MKYYSIFIVFFVNICAAFADQVKLDISWSIDQKTEVCTNNQTKISFPKTIANFTQKRATPANKDGSASFAYLNDQGIITIYLTHRLLMGFSGNNDCIAQFRETFIDAMRKANGKTDSEGMFKFIYEHDGKNLAGLGMTAHFVSSPVLGGLVFSEFGAVLVGDFIYYYRGSFSKKNGLRDLEAFLKAIGFKKKKN